MTLNCVEQCPIPAVKTVVVPSANPDAGYKYSRFGLLTLTDGSSGFFYRLLDSGSATFDDVQSLSTHPVKEGSSLPDSTLRQWVSGYTSGQATAREIGMASINAVSQHVFRQCGLDVTDAQYSVERYSEQLPTHHKKVGMVGYFRPLVEHLQRSGIPLVVLELDASLHRESPGLQVTNEIDALIGSDYLICTASTLLNHSLDALLAQLAEHCFFELIGPTAGCLPDALFERGVNAVGGSCVVSLSDASSRIAAMQQWGDTVVKYVLTPDNYPGITTLLSRYQPLTTDH